MVKKRKSTWKVGVSRLKMRKVGGKRRKCKVTKMSKGKYRVRVVGAKKRKKAVRRKKRRK